MHFCRLSIPEGCGKLAGGELANPRNPIETGLAPAGAKERPFTIDPAMPRFY